MNIVRSRSHTLVAVAAVGSLLFLGGCGTSESEASGDTSQTTASASPSENASGNASGTASAASSDTASPSSPATETITTSADTAAETAAPVETADAAPTPTDAIQNRCTAGMLSGDIVTNPGAGSAGGVHREMVLTNTGSKDCVLHGWAGVSYVADGDQVGAPAERESEKAPVANALKPGESAAAPLTETSAGKYTECVQVKTTAIRVYPPEDTSSLLIPFESTGCSNQDIELLTIGTFQPFTPAK